MWIHDVITVAIKFARWSNLEGFLIFKLIWKMQNRGRTGYTGTFIKTLWSFKCDFHVTPSQFFINVFIICEHVSVAKVRTFWRWGLKLQRMLRSFPFRAYPSAATHTLSGLQASVKKVSSSRCLGMDREGPTPAPSPSAGTATWGQGSSRRKQEGELLHMSNPQKPLIILTRLHLSLKETF